MGDNKTCSHGTAIEEICFDCQIPMCPHGRPEGYLCPHCAGINGPHTEIKFAVPTDAPTLRDQFAMAALTGLTNKHDDSPVGFAEGAYRIADAMLFARADGEDGE